jgi:hypothetical protein
MLLKASTETRVAHREREREFVKVKEEGTTENE